MSVPALADTKPAVRTILLFVTNPSEKAKDGWIFWIKSFQIGLRYLMSDFATAGSDASLTIKVVLTSKQVDDVIDPDVLKNSFESSSHLEVPSTLGLYAGQWTIVKNDVYLGDFKGSLSDPYVYISREITPEMYAITREALAAVTLYAYAMAIAKMLPEDGNPILVCRVLARANRYKDQSMGAEMEASLDGLFKAISTELK